MTGCSVDMSAKGTLRVRVTSDPVSSPAYLTQSVGSGEVQHINSQTLLSCLIQRL